MRSISTRLILAFASVVVFLIAQGVFSIHNTRTVSQVQSQALHQELAVSALAEDIDNVRLAVFKLLETMAPAEMDAFRAEYERGVRQVNEAMSGLGMDSAPFLRCRETYDTIIGLQYDFSANTARTLMSGRSRVEHDALREVLAGKRAELEAGTHARMARAERHSLYVVGGLCGAALLVAIGWAIALRRSLTDRRRAEQALRNSEQNYREIFNSSNDAIFVHEMATGEIVDVNRTMCRMFGYPHEEALRVTIQDISQGEPPYSQAEAGQWIKKAVEEGPQAFEWWSRRKGGELFWVEVHLSRVTVGGRDRVIAVSRDITERKQAEVLLKESERKFRAVFNNTFEFMGVLTVDGGMVEANQTALDFGGLQESDVRGKPFWETPWWRHSPEIQDWLRVVVRKAAAGETVRGEVDSLSVDGKTRYIDFSIRPLRDENDDVALLIPEGRDVTERKQAELELRASEERFRGFAAASSYGLAMGELNGQLVFANAAALRILEEETEEAFTSRTFYQYYTPEDAEHLRQEILPTVLKEGQWVGELPLLSGKGKPVTTEQNIFLIRDENGIPRMIGNIITDIADRKKAQEERRAHVKFLESLAQVDRIIQQTDDVEQMLWDVLNTTFQVFECDRAWLLYPCDPASRTYRIPMEVAGPGYRGGGGEEGDLAMDDGTEAICATALAAPGPVTFGPGNDHPISDHKAAQTFQVLGQMVMSVSPRIGKPWMFGIHQCSHQRAWTEEERRLFNEIGRRISDALSTLLILRDLRESEERFSLAMEANRDGLWDWNVSTDEVYFSPGYTAMLGYSPGEIPAHVGSWKDLLHPEDKDAALNAIMDCVDNHRQDFGVEFRMRAKNGEWRWVLGRGKAVARDDSGRAVRMIGTTTDITERKRVEQVLWEKAFMIESAASTIATADLNGNMIYANPAFLASWGYDDFDEVRGRPFPEFWMVGDQLTEIREALLGRGGGKWFGEIKAKRKDDSLFDVQVSAATVYDGEGEPVAMMSTSIDISERKQAEERLVESERLFRAVFDQAAQFMGVLTPDGTVININRAAREFIGRDEPELVGNPFWETPWWAHAVEYQEQLRAAIQDASHGGSARFETTHPRTDGNLAYVDFSLTPVKDEDGEVVFLIPEGRDITESKRAAQEMQRLRNLLKNIIDSMPSAIVGVDHEGCVMQWNREAENITGVTPSQAHGRPLGDVFPQLEGQLDNVFQAIATRKAHQSVKTAHKVNGENRFSEVTVFPLIANGVEGAVVRVDDVTNRVRIEEMMVQTEKMMSVGGLAAGMAHEINNPLAGILQGAQNIERRVLPDLPGNVEAAQACGTSVETVRAYLERRDILKFLTGIRESGGRAAKIVANMLQFSRQSDSRLVPSNLAELIDRAVDLAENDYDLKKRYDFRHIEIVREYDDELPPVPVVATEIEQVLLNLLKNAAQAVQNREAGESPKLILRARNDGDMARIEVEDNGPGMPEDVRKRVFEPFFTTKEVGVGTGLGLSVSYMIVTNNHGGTMSVESAPGNGARFVVRLPVTEKR